MTTTEQRPWIRRRERRERVLGTAAVRFAKTIRSKLDKQMTRSLTWWAFALALAEIFMRPALCYGAARRSSVICTASLRA